MSSPSRAADCLEPLVVFPTAIETMRAAGDDATLPRAARHGIRAAFDSLQPTDESPMLFVAGAAQDLLYRHVMQLTTLDRYTRAYCVVAVRYFFQRLTAFRLRTFYILDNTLREDRFHLVLELFDLCGIATTTPRHDSAVWDNLASKLLDGLSGVGHVAYIEPDATVNHLELARQLAKQNPCVGTFRNLHPDDPQHEIINFKRLAIS